VVPLLYPADRWHAAAREFFAKLRSVDRLSTTWPVITECPFALVRNRAALFKWLGASGIEVVDFALEDLEWTRNWSERYADREIDFADASLVRLAVRHETNLIATTAFNDFEVYRLPNRRPFKLLIPR
jgi:predicted nucleic acid-binding protein